MKTYTMPQYAEHLGTTEGRITRAVRQVIVRGALNIRDDWRTRAREANKTHAPKYASTIGMRRVVTTGNEIVAVVEPGQFGQGNLGQVLEYGHGLTRNAPQMSHLKAITVEAPKLAEWLARVSRDTIT